MLSFYPWDDPEEELLEVLVIGLFDYGLNFGDEMKPAVLDLCKGLGGWTRGLKAAGWWVAGVDIEDYSQMTGYVEPDAFILADVREIAKDVQAYFPALKFDLVVASPPCQEFSYSGFPFKKARERFNKDNPPDRSIWDACVKIAKDLDTPLILENVRNARPWMGPASWNYGSYYFWGEMPALLPIGRPFKGFHRSKTGKPNSSDPWGQFSHMSYQGVSDRRDNFRAHGERGHAIQREPFPGEKERIEGLATANLSARKIWSATVAMIPEEISEWIGRIYYPRDLK